MKTILLIGLGRFGRHLAMRFNELGHQVMAIDCDEERVHDILPYVTNGQIGDASDPAYLQTLGVDDFDLCIVAIAHDFESSMITTSMLKDLGAKKVISRACTDIQEKLLKNNGADIVAYPEKQVATWTALRYCSDMIFDYLDLNDGFSIYEVSVPATWVGKTVVELDIRKKNRINIMAIKKDGKLDMIIGPNTRFVEGSTILVLGKTEDIQSCFKI